MFHGGECALADGNSVSEADIESIKNNEIVIATILFLSVFMFFVLLFLLFLYFSFPQFYFVLSKKP